MAGRFDRSLYLVAAATLLVAAAPAAASAGSSERFELLVADAKSTMLIDPRMAVDKARAAEAFADSTRDKRKRALMQATGQWLRGEALLRLNAIDQAAPLIERALATAAAVDPASNLRAELLLSAGGIATERADVGQALIHYQAAHDIFQKIGDTRSRAKALIQMASLYANANDQLNALKYFGQALDVYHADPGLSVAILNGRGNAYKELGRFREAEDQFAEALVLARRMRSPLNVATVLCNLIRSRLLTNRLDQARRDIAEGMRLTATGDAAAMRPVMLGIAAQAALLAGDLRGAQTLIDGRFRGEDLSTTMMVDRDAHETAYKIYRAIGQSDDALPHLAALKRIDDEATKLARSTNAALMAARFDFANQELKIAKLRQDELQRKIAFERASARNQRYMFGGLTAATLVVVAMLIFALFTSRRSRAKVQAANADLAVTNSALGKALAAKTEFLATTSHEIRTPLNGILGMTQVMLADPKLAAATRDRISVVHGAGVTMRALVDDILDVAKMETGNLTIEAAPFDLRATIAESTRLWDDQAAAKGLHFVRELDACPRMIEGDSARLRQIVFNLLSNALKFTAAGEVSLRIAPHGTDRYRISVSDSGIGIPADKLEEIFESFRQADAGTTRQFGGTGLGLSICRNLARAMNGDVSVSSVMGEGTVFTVDLPLVPAAAATATVADTGPALLVIDRNPITRAMLRTLLLPRAGRVESVASIDDAIACLARGEITRIVIDDQVVRARVEPSVDSHAELRRLTAAAAAYGVHVALLWPVTAEQEHAELLATGIDQVVAKPITGAALVAALFCTSTVRLVDHRLVPQAA